MTTNENGYPPTPGIEDAQNRDSILIARLRCIVELADLENLACDLASSDLTDAEAEALGIIRARAGRLAIAALDDLRDRIREGSL